MNCSRSLPGPIKIYGAKSQRLRLRYVIYPSLDRFRAACKKCRFLGKVDKSKNGSGYRCKIEDPFFGIKFYGISKELKGRLFVGTVPPTLKSRNPRLYGEVVTFIDEHGARSFRERASSGFRQRKRTRLDLADGIDVLLGRRESKPAGSGDVEIVPKAVELSKNTRSLTSR